MNKHICSLKMKIIVITVLFFCLQKSNPENNAFQIYQALGYCHLNSDGTRQAYMAHAFNGHDYVSFDVETQTWTAAVSSAVFYKRKREADQFDIIRLSYLYRYLCTEMLKTVLKYAPWVKERKVPQVHLIEKHALTSSKIEVTCHVTGFYPRDIRVEWLGAGGLPLVEGVRSGEELPNGDGTYQLRTSLTITEESQGTQSYSCLVIHSSVSENVTVTWGHHAEPVDDHKTGGPAEKFPFLTME
ncbi:hypothetical protein JZ751_017178 [Albula glossodonta]|uniref:Ig-like domain-containing protein n=1 Tax=Albula glossodonta TaxID=121402 RepID=A0A8T2NXM8_9TELE|nr:hypothetical protein JZ751_017178 [Albula glossodonta]